MGAQVLVPAATIGSSPTIINPGRISVWSSLPAARSHLYILAENIVYLVTIGTHSPSAVLSHFFPLTSVDCSPLHYVGKICGGQFPPHLKGVMTDMKGVLLLNSWNSTAFHVHKVFKSIPANQLLLFLPF